MKRKRKRGICNRSIRSLGCSLGRVYDIWRVGGRSNVIKHIWHGVFGMYDACRLGGTWVYDTCA